MNRAHLVRPRWVWSGLALGLLGAALFALWTASWHPIAGIAGVVLMLLGAAVAWRGGILYDTRGSHDQDPQGPNGATKEATDLVHGRVHRGTSPGDMVTDPRLRAEAVVTTRRTKALLQASEATPRPAFDTLGSALLLGGAVALVAIQGMYAHSSTGQANGLRSLLLGVVIALSALRLLLGQHPGRMPSVVAVLCGVALIVCALVIDHDQERSVVVEIVIGAWVVLMALLSLDHAPAAAAAPERPAVSDRPRRQVARGPRTWPDNARIGAVTLVVSATALSAGALARRLVSGHGHGRAAR